MVTRKHPATSAGFVLATTCSKVYGHKLFQFKVYPVCVSSKHCTFIENVFFRNTLLGSLVGVQKLCVNVGGLTRRRTFR